MTINNITPAMPAPRSPLATVPSEGLAKTQENHTAKEIKSRDNLLRRGSALGHVLQSAVGIDDVQVDGVGNFHAISDDTMRCLLISHALDPKDAIVTLGAGLKAVRKPDGQWTMLRPLMRKTSGVRSGIESFLMKAVGVKPYVTQVQTPGKKHLEGEALTASKQRNIASLVLGRDQHVQHGGVQLIAPQGNVQGPGPFDIAGVGAVKAFSQADDKPVAFITAGITYEPLVPQSGVRQSVKVFFNIGKPFIVTRTATDDNALARALEVELAKVHTFTASGIAGAHIFKQRDEGKKATLFEDEFKAVVTRFVDNITQHSDVNVDGPLLDRNTRDAYLHKSYKTLVAKGFVDRQSGEVRKVGLAVDFEQAPKLRPDARAAGLALTDPLRYNGNRVRQVMRASTAVAAAFEVASESASAQPARSPAARNATHNSCAVM
jgi:hypothetical protein